MSTKRWGAPLVALAVALVAVGAGAGRATPGPRLDAGRLGCEACVLVAGDGEVLFARAARRPLPNASTTKIATALVVAAASDPDDAVRVSRRAAATPGGGLALAAGDTATTEDLLHALLLASSNDAAVALAEHVAGTEARFVARMNSLARSLGARRTHFVTAHGLDAPGHHSAARDLARLGAALLDVPRLAAIVRRPRAIVTISGTAVTLENRNPLVHTYRGAVGIKTGMTAGAGNVLVAAARRSGRLMLAVAMRSPDPAADARLMLDHGFAVTRRAVVVDASRPVAALVFPSGAVAVRPAVPVRARPARPVVTRVVARARAPVATGERVGEVLVGAAGEAGRVGAVADASVPPASTPWPVAVLAALLRAAASLVGRAG